MAELFSHELIIPNEGLPFKLFLFEGQDGNYRRAKHWHRAIEIFLVAEGELEFFLNNRLCPLKAPDFVIVNSNEIHSITALTPNRTIVVQIPFSCFSHYLAPGDYGFFSRQSEEYNLLLVHLIARIYQVYQQKKYAYELEVQSLFFRLVHLLVTRFMENEQNPESIRQKRQLDKLSDITDYIKKNYDQNISLESVADHFGFSPTYLSRMFRKYADISYKAYVLDLRTEHGRREMINTDHSLNDIALNNGFPNSRAFAKAFRKRYGCLPSEYRAQAASRQDSLPYKARKCYNKAKFPSGKKAPDTL